MRSPVSRVCAAVVFIFAITGVALWFNGNGATLTFADVVKPFLEATSAKFKTTNENQGKIYSVQESMWLAPDLIREVHKRNGKTEAIVITDYEKHKQLELYPDEKRAVVTEFLNIPKEMPFHSIFVERRQELLGAKDKPGITQLGESEIDGRQTVGYRMKASCLVDPADPNPPKAWRMIWADPVTMLPIREEFTSEKDGKILCRSTVSNYEFNLDFDKSLFSLEPPEGYKVKKETRDYAPPTDKDLVETFRQYTDLSGGPFPDSLDYDTIFKAFADSPKVKSAEKQKKLTDQQQREFNEIQTKLVGGVMFTMGLQPVNDAHYAGKGVSLDAAETPIFWYRPKDSKQYRVIYGDLTIRQADTPPNVANAQPVPAPLSSKK